MLKNLIATVAMTLLLAAPVAAQPVYLTRATPTTPNWTWTQVSLAGLAAGADDTTLVSSGAAWVATAVPACAQGPLGYNATTNAFACASPLTVGNGGTGLTGATDDTAMIGSGTAWVSTAVPNCASGLLAYATTGNSFSCVANLPWASLPTGTGNWALAAATWAVVGYNIATANPYYGASGPADLAVLMADSAGDAQGSTYIRNRLFISSPNDPVDIRMATYTTADGSNGSHQGPNAGNTAGAVSAKLHWDAIVASGGGYTHGEYVLIQPRLPDERMIPVRSVWPDSGAQGVTVPAPAQYNHPGEFELWVYPEWGCPAGDTGTPTEPNFEGYKRLRLNQQGVWFAGGGGCGNSSSIPEASGGHGGGGNGQPSHGFNFFGGGIRAIPLSAPGSVTATKKGAHTAGGTTYTYYVGAVDVAGNIVQSTSSQVTNALAALNATNYVEITWSTIPGAEYYYVFKDDVETAVYLDAASAIQGKCTNDENFIFGGNPDASAIRVQSSHGCFDDKYNTSQPVWNVGEDDVADLSGDVMGKSLSVGLDPYSACHLKYGSGDPNAAVYGKQCDMFIRTDAASNAALYIKTSGTPNAPSTANWLAVDTTP